MTESAASPPIVAAGLSALAGASLAGFGVAVIAQQQRDIGR